MKAVRWSDNDRRWGPFTYANENRADGRGREERRQFGVVLTSGRTDEDEGACAIRLHLRGRTLIIALPQIVKPAANWVSTAHYAWSKGPNSGYWDVHSRDIGFLFVMGALHIYRGRVTGDSDTDRSVVWFLPWKGWRHVRFSLYGLDGTHIWSQFDKDRPVGREVGSDGVAVAWRAGGFYDQRYDAEKACPTATFSFLDFDQEPLTAATQIQEREWHRGEGRFKWLSWVTKPKIRRSLDIRFSGETGKRKGSWKGGTVGHSIDMLPGELHQAAFRRYCAAHSMTFVGVPANNG